MTFTTTITAKTSDGNKRVHYGTFTAQSGDFTGAVKTGLRVIEAFIVSPTVVGSTAVARTAIPVKLTYPVVPGDSSGILIVLSSGVSSGVWQAIGKV